MSGISGINVDNLSAHRDFTRLIDTLVIDITKRFKVGGDLREIDRVAWLHDWRCGVEVLRRGIEARGGFACADQRKGLMISVPVEDTCATQRRHPPADVAWRSRCGIAREGIAGRTMQNDHVGGCGRKRGMNRHSALLVERKEQYIAIC